MSWLFAFHPSSQNLFIGKRVLPNDCGKLRTAKSILTIVFLVIVLFSLSDLTGGGRPCGPGKGSGYSMICGKGGGERRGCTVGDVF